MLETDHRVSDRRVVYRYVSHLVKDTVALVLAGGRGSRLHELTEWRAKPGVYFGGKYRIIDFPLSNCINSDIRRIGVLTQYKSHSLIRHLVRGWSHFKKELGEFVEVLPASQRFSEEWYQGTADAVYQNLDIIRAEKPKYVMILSGDHIYRMDYRTMLLNHVENGADMTVSCLEVPVEEAAGAFGVMESMSQIGLSVLKKNLRIQPRYQGTRTSPWPRWETTSSTRNFYLMFSTRMARTKHLNTILEKISFHQLSTPITSTRSHSEIRKPVDKPIGGMSELWTHSGKRTWNSSPLLQN